jgi:transposase
LKPHQSRYWLNHDRAADPQQFDTDVRTICELYHHAQERHEHGVYVVSTDEKTGIQANERAHPTRPMQPGLVERVEFEYIRHGTQTLIANFEVATGQVMAPSVGATRTEEDFVGHIERTIARDPAAAWVFIVDRLNTHQSESLVRFVAKQCGIEENVGVKGKAGILESMSTRAAFLYDPTHRIRFVYTPKHTSWLNQVEIWFGILVRRLLKRASFTSVDDRRERLLAFIAYFNKTMAKPFKWTYAGRPLVAYPLAA